MTASVNSPVDVLNISLAQIGYPRRIGDIFEGSPASKMGLDLYAETRDEVLRSKDWGFANGAIVLSLLKSAPSNGYSSGSPWTTASPPIPWLYEYTYPTDCLRVLYIYSAQMPLPNNDPLPVTFKIANDAAESPPVRVILTNQVAAAMVYTRQVTDMTQWDTLFVRTLTSALSKKLSSIGKGQQFLELLKMEQEMETASEAQAEAQEET